MPSIFKKPALNGIADNAVQRALRPLIMFCEDMEKLIGLNFNSSGTAGTPTLNQPTGPGAFDHGLLAGLDDDDHPQYPQHAEDEDIEGLWRFLDGLELVEPGGPSATHLRQPHALSADVNWDFPGHAVDWPISTASVPGGVKLPIKIGSNGNIEYQPELEMIMAYGNEPDGSATLDGATSFTSIGLTLASSTYTATRDLYMDDLTVNSGVSLNMNGHRLFVSGTLTNEGTILYDGNPGVAGANAVVGGGSTLGGAGGAALDSGGAVRPLGGSTAGTSGRNGAIGAGGVATGVPITANGEGGNGGGGGSGEQGGGGAAGGAATSGTNETIKRWRTVGVVMTWNFLYLIEGGTGGRGGSSGAGDGVSLGAAGGGGGSGGGVLLIWARFIVNNGTIRARGGAGGNGGNSDSSGGAGGGGGGGGGGFVYMLYDTFTGNAPTASGGAGGAVGANGTGGTPGTDGAAGGAGAVVRFNRLKGVFE